MACPHCLPSAIELAALHKHYEIFDIKQLRLDPKDSRLQSAIYFFCDEAGFPILQRLLNAGMDPNEVNSGICPAISSLPNSLDWTYSLASWEQPRDREKLDTRKAPQAMKAIHLLLKHGAKWSADDKSSVSSVRRALLKMKPDYIVEFIWLLSKYGSCTRQSAETLICTASMKRHLDPHRARIQQLIDRLNTISSQSR